MARVHFKNPVIRWIDERMPVFSMLHGEYAAFPTPRNFNYFWNFGAIAMVILATMIVTGIVLAMHYTPHKDHAFDSVERIMRDVNYGWLIRYIHANGASMFFVAVFIHMFRGLYYGSYKKPRELLWILGVIIFLLMMATAFMGYCLPWGQMSFWGVTVITNLFSAIPLVGDDVRTLLWGGFSVDNQTLNRFFSLHYLLPFVIAAVVFLHIVALHIVGSNNPLGIEPKGPEDTVPFHPYYTVKDTFGTTIFLMLFAFFVFYAPNYLGHADNYIPANPLSTPAHIVPEWYFLPFYAILRAVPDKLGGVLLMFGAIAVLFVVPWLDTSKVRSTKFRPVYKIWFWVLVVTCLALGWCGQMPPEGAPLIISRIATVYYFLHFLVVMPVIGIIERPRALPASIAEAVLKANKRPTVAALLVLIGLGVAGPALAQTPAAEAPAAPAAPAAAPAASTPAKPEAAPAEHAAEEASSHDARHPEQLDWSFKGPFGTFERDSAQRGFLVFKQVCASCHAAKYLRFRNLMDLGFTEAEVKQVIIDGDYKVQDGPDDSGAMFDRPATLADVFPRPFPNDQAARASNGGALPPDLSLITKARHDGPNYIYSLMIGYEAPPAGVHVADGLSYNPYFTNHQIAMPAPLTEDGVTYADGTKATIKQQARDVAMFLTWLGEPNLEQRHRMGAKVMFFLLCFAIVMYGAKKRVWANVKLRDAA